MANEMLPMDEEEISRLRERLQEKYDNLCHIYQSKSHKRFFNTEWEKKRKDDQEKQIAMLKAY